MVRRFFTGEIDGMVANVGSSCFLLLSSSSSVISSFSFGRRDDVFFCLSCLAASNNAALSLHVDIGRALRYDFLGDEENPEILVDIFSKAKSQLQWHRRGMKMLVGSIFRSV